MPPRYTPNDEPPDGGDTDAPAWYGRNRTGRLLAAASIVLAVVVLGSGLRGRRHKYSQHKDSQ